MFNYFTTLAIIAISANAVNQQWRDAWRDARSTMEDGQDWSDRQAFRQGMKMARSYMNEQEALENALAEEAARKEAWATMRTEF